MRIERALGAFDMFMLHDNEGDINEVMLCDVPLHFNIYPDFFGRYLKYWTTLHHDFAAPLRELTR